MALKLEKLNGSMKAALDEFAYGWDAVPRTVRKYGGDIDGFMRYLDTLANDPPRLMAPSDLFFLTDGDAIIGAAEVRHFLNDGLYRYGGHINFGVAPRHRGKGMGRQMLEMLKPRLKNMGLDRVLLCCEEENEAGLKTILKAGGVPENKVEIIRGGVRKTGVRCWMDTEQLP